MKWNYPVLQQRAMLQYSCSPEYPFSLIL